MVQYAAFVDGDLGLGWRNLIQTGRLICPRARIGRVRGEKNHIWYVQFIDGGEYRTHIKVLFVSQSISFYVSARFFLINRRVLEVLRTVRRLEAAVNKIKGRRWLHI